MGPKFPQAPESNRRLSNPVWQPLVLGRPLIRHLLRKCHLSPGEGYRRVTGAFPVPPYRLFTAASSCSMACFSTARGQAALSRM